MILALLGGVLLLTFGAELLVRGAARLAAAASVPPLVIGLTVVAFGTSAPELAVSLGATFADRPGIAVGNVVGSNIFNVLFILGLSALVVPLAVARQLIRLDVPVMIAVSVLLLVMSLDGRIGRMDGALLFAGLIGYSAFVVRQGRMSVIAEAEALGGPGRAHTRTALLLRSAAAALGGLLLLVLGSQLFVDGAVTLARLLGVGETVIGLTIIAAGTSLPELATSVLASLRGQRDIAVGNIIGSNIFNILAILGLCGLLGPSGLAVEQGLIAFDIPIMIAVAAATLPILFTGLRISRAEGALFVSYYAAYTLYLVLDATRHGAREPFSDLMLFAALPLTLLLLTVATVRSLAAR